jgi:hypothetical protein
MSEIKIACVKQRPKRVGGGIHRQVYRVGGVALKIERARERDLKKLHERGVKLLAINLELRERLDFLPKFYGVALTTVEKGGKSRPAVITFHEYVKPIPVYSLQSLRSLRAVINLIMMARRQGFYLDIKPGNFGSKRGKVYYLDELGVGKGPIPLDVLEDLAKLLRLKLPVKIKISPR